jgi:hypothetical protein
MADPMKPEFTAQNPIVAAAEKIRARRTIDTAADGDGEARREFDDAESGLRAFAKSLADGMVRINAIVGERDGLKLVRLEKPLRLRIRFKEKRIALDLDEMHQLVRIAGQGFDGEYQFVPNADVPALINVSIVSTESGYGDALTASSLLKRIAQDAELPRPSHLDRQGPIVL